MAPYEPLGPKRRDKVGSKVIYINELLLCDLDDHMKVVILTNLNIINLYNYIGELSS